MESRNENLLGAAIADGTMRAAAEILHQRGMIETVDVPRLVEALRVEAVIAMHSILDQGRSLADGGALGWVTPMFRVECVDAARRAIASLTPTTGEGR